MANSIAGRNNEAENSFISNPTIINLTFLDQLLEKLWEISNVNNNINQGV